METYRDIHIVQEANTCYMAVEEKSEYLTNKSLFDFRDFVELELDKTEKFHNEMLLKSPGELLNDTSIIPSMESSRKLSHAPKRENDVYLNKGTPNGKVRKLTNKNQVSFDDRNIRQKIDVQRKDFRANNIFLGESKSTFLNVNANSDFNRFLCTNHENCSEEGTVGITNLKIGPRQNKNLSINKAISKSASAQSMDDSNISSLCNTILQSSRKKERVTFDETVSNLKKNSATDGYPRAISLPTHCTTRITLPLVCKFRPSNRAIWCLNSASSSECQIWFAVHEEPNLSQMSDKGELKKTVKLQNNVYDVTAMPSGCLLLTLVLEHSIWKIQPDCAPERFFQFNDMYPCGIHAAASFCIYVGLANPADTRTSEHGAHVIKLSNLGSVIQKYEFDQNNKRLFTLPYRIHENINGDVCVVDWINDRNSRLVILHPQGKLKTVYSGLHGDFKAGGITCSRNGNILICDIMKDNIHVLNQLGECLMLVDAVVGGAPLYGPCDLTFDAQNRLWVGCCRGHVYCLKFWDAFG